MLISSSVFICSLFKHFSGFSYELPHRLFCHSSLWYLEIYLQNTRDFMGEFDTSCIEVKLKHQQMKIRRVHSCGSEREIPGAYFFCVFWILNSTTYIQVQLLLTSVAPVSVQLL